jgi:hypothetical protein
MLVWLEEEVLAWPLQMSVLESWPERWSWLGHGQFSLAPESEVLAFLAQPG